MTDNELKGIIHGRVNIQVGKNGINDGIVDQIKEQFKKNKYLKIKFLDLHMFDSTKEASNTLARRVNASVEDIRGKTCVLQRRRSDN